MNTHKELDLKPCGKCDIGTYSEPAMLNKIARAFGALPANERISCMPSCKTHERVCRGAVDFHNMICMIDELYPADNSSTISPKRYCPQPELTNSSDFRPLEIRSVIGSSSSVLGPLVECVGQRDGDCDDPRCPQLKNRQSHCPLDTANQKP